MTPILGAWVPDGRGPVGDAHAAVEDLRWLVMTRSTMAANARDRAGLLDERDRRGPGTRLIS